MEKTFKFRIYPNKEQERKIQKTFGCVRFVYNYYLNIKFDALEKNNSIIPHKECSADLPVLKTKHTWLKEVDSTALQSALRDLDYACKNFLKKRKKGIDFTPKFRDKFSAKKSFTSRMSIYLGNNYVKLPKLNKVKCKVSRSIEGRIISANVSQTESGRYYVALTCSDVDIRKLIKTNKEIGVDLGLTSLVTTSDGYTIDNPNYFVKANRKIVKLKKSIINKENGKNKEKSKIKYFKYLEKINNKKTDYLHKVSKKIITENDHIGVEDLNINRLMKNRRLGYRIKGSSWSQLLYMMEYKAKFSGKSFVKVSRIFPSSQTCSDCGFINKKIKDLSVRKWVCLECGGNHDRDINAAKNILKESKK